MLTSQAFPNVTPPFQSANDVGQKKPIYYIKFGLVTGPLGTNSQILPTQYCTGPIKNQTVARKRYMSAPNTAPQQINRVTYVFSLSALTFNLQDINAEITSMISSYVIKNRLVSIYKGYEDIDEVAYIQVYQGQVNNCVRSQDGTFYTFTVTDAQKQLDTDILKGHTQLTKNFNPGDTIMHVNSSFYFAQSTDMNDGFGARNYLRINDFLFSYSGQAGGTLTDNTVTWSWIGGGTVTATTPQWLSGHAYVIGNMVFNTGNVYKCVIAGTSASSGGPNGYGTQGSIFFNIKQINLNASGNSLSQTIQAGAQVDNYINFQGNPVDIMLQIILSTGTGTNKTAGQTNYDVLPACQGIGVPISLVNVANFQKQRDRFISWIYFSNNFSEQVTGLKFFQQHIYRQAQCYLFTNKSGQLDINMVYYPLPQANPITIDLSNVKGIPQFNSNLQTGNDFYNEIDARWDYKPVGDLFVSNELFTQLGSQQTYEERSVMEIECRFVNSRDDGQKVVDRMINIMSQRFRNPLPLIQCDCFAQLQPINVGDKVLLNHPQVPNLNTGKLGGSYICEVVGSTPDYVNDVIHLTLFAIGLSTPKRYAVIGPAAPAGTPAYTSASSNKNYAYVSTVLASNSAIGQMSIGDDGYYITG